MASTPTGRPNSAVVSLVQAASLAPARLGHVRRWTGGKAIDDRAVEERLIGPVIAAGDVRCRHVGDRCGHFDLGCRGC